MAYSKGMFLGLMTVYLRMIWPMMNPIFCMEIKVEKEIAMIQRQTLSGHNVNPTRGGRERHMWDRGVGGGGQSCLTDNNGVCHPPQWRYQPSPSLPAYIQYDP